MLCLGLKKHFKDFTRLTLSFDGWHKVSTGRQKIKSGLTLFAFKHQVSIFPSLFSFSNMTSYSSRSTQRLLPSHVWHFLLEWSTLTIERLVMPDWNAWKGAHLILEPLQWIRVHQAGWMGQSCELWYMTSTLWWCASKGQQANRPAVTATDTASDSKHFLSLSNS